jgi:putative nucleotidyltransferase with HDIG domain
MRRIFTRLSNRHENVFKYVIILIAVLSIVIALPKETSFNYDFQAGKPWGYDNLIAPFSFPIAKTETELTEEKAAVLKNAHPFYRFDDQLVEQKKAQLEEELSQAAKEVTASATKKVKPVNLDQQIKIGKQLLQQIYRQGVILPATNQEIDHREGLITVLQNNVAEDHYTREFQTVRTALEEISQLLDSIPEADRSLLGPILENCLAHNVVYDDIATRNWTRQLMDQISLNRGLVQQGEVIILKGEVVDESKRQKLESLRLEMKNQELSGSSRWMMFFGHFILVSLAIGILITFLFLFRREMYDDNSRVTLLMMLIVAIVWMFLWILKLEQFDIYLAPVCILPIVVRAFYDTRTALFTHIVTLLILGFEAPNGFEYMFIQTIAGMVAIFTIVSMSRRVQFFISVFMIFLSYSVAFTGIAILHEANFREIDWLNLRWFLGNSVITLFAFPLIFIVEKSFGFLSDVSLMELADSNSPVLRELAMKAPGTFQHSMQVANLAEAAVFKIGGNPLLVRAGAMYHDIGKADMANYFIENQNNHFNPHDELSFEESARVIKSHVIKGVEKARKAKVPDIIIDFIRTHHGTSRLQYFYQSYLKNFPEKVPDEELFRYPGPLPYSKETTVLMMADSVEAASRSLKSADPESIDKLVDGIIDHQMETGQYDNAPVTLRDIRDIRKIFKKMLMSMYHARIDYPE